jgi:serine protease Do
MRRFVLISIALFPLLLGFSQAAQNWSVDPPSQPFAFSSDESGSTSYLGVDIADVTNERLSALKLKEEKGVEVTMVDQDAPAGKAGIKEHDVILTMNGNSVESTAQLRRMIHETPAGRVVALGLSRDGQPMTVKVQLGDKHKDYGMVAPNSKKEFYFEMPKMPAMPEIDIPTVTVMTISSARSGLTVENITPQLGDFLGVKNGNGVLVRSVDKGSRADKAGFRAGDVIVKINDESVHDTSDFTRAVRSRNGNSVNVGVVRDKKEQNLSLEVPEKKQSGDLLQEESFDDQDVNVESRIELGQLNDEIAKARPEIALAVEESTRQATEETLCKTLREQQKQMREQSEKLNKEFRLQQQQFRQDLRKQQENMKHSLKRMQIEMHSFDI